ncbi:hypothetical protein Ndes2526B_g02020 [Nannochloris sp. 'desiccata']|nr:hypothetical protein KSW81_004138 [Chlorella desiccata (nom. nud.)]KAH7623577.1 putative Pleiotropic drug resistance protein 3 [Chlorella desiccata (nom. nud.)]
MAASTNGTLATGDNSSQSKFKNAPTFLSQRTGMLVSFRNITYTVQNEANKKEQISLLQSVSGYLRSGELVALMGPSGSGKTTLLDILAGRKTVGKLSGEILFGGVAPTKMFLRRFTGYCEQQDTLVPNLTVEEFLRYTAELKIEVSVPAAEKSQAVERVIDQLALDTCRHTLIGSPNRRGISGGQGKRVNIGIALISNPHVLFLDEPTSGLDSYTSNEVMTVVKNLASTGITICATIHSPTPYCFGLFDRMLLLLSGKMVYFGRNGTQATEYLHNNASDIATTITFDNSNIADWITDVTVVADRTGRADELAAKYEKSELKSHADKELDVQLRETRDLPPETAAALAVKKETTTPTWHAFKVLFGYRLVRNYQSLEFYLSRAMPWIFQTIIIFSVFWQIGEKVNPSNVVNIVAIIFFWSIAPAFAAASFVPAIMLSRPLYFRERNDGLFRPITFLMYLMAEEIIVAIPVSFIACTMMWFGAGLQGSYIMWWCSFAISFVVGISSAYFISAMSPSMDVANAAVPIYGVLCMFFSGFLIRIPDMGWWWRWAVWCCPTYYAVSAQIKNFFSGDRDIEFINGQTVTEYYAVDYLPAWGFVGMQLIFPTVFLTLAWLALAYKVPIKR